VSDLGDRPIYDAPPEVELGPVPTLVVVGQAQGPDGNMVTILRISTPLGVQNYFLSPAHAESIGKALIEISMAARSNLVIPNGPVQ